MARPDSSMFETRRLRHFLMAVESESLQIAAEQLFLTQQALSASIRQLEREVGVDLFDRSGRKLRLTAPGRTLYDGAKPLLAGNASLTRAVRATAAGDPTPFVIGHTPAISGDEVFRLLTHAIDRFPAQPFTARQVFPGEIQEQLFDNTIDMALRRGIDAPPNLASAVFAYNTLRLAVTADHPLADGSSLRAHDLAGTPIVVWAPERSSFYTDYLVSYCRRAGFEPDLIVNMIQGTPPYTAVQRYRHACAFVTDETVPIDGSVRLIDFVDPPFVPVQALWLPNTHSEPRAAIIGDHP